jgi:CRISPR-associated protein Csx16
MPVVAHLDKPGFGPGDKVFGVLPLGLAADVCASGAEVFVLTYETPFHLRGQELSADELERLGARLVRYDVRVITPGHRIE